MSESQNASQKRVYSGLSEGTTIRFDDPGFAPPYPERTGEIVDVNEDPAMCAFTKYKVEHCAGWSWVPANDVTEVVDRA